MDQLDGAVLWLPTLFDQCAALSAKLNNVVGGIPKTHDPETNLFELGLRLIRGSQETR